MLVNYQKTMSFFTVTVTSVNEIDNVWQKLCQLSSKTACGKSLEKMSPILVTLTSRSDSDFERSNVSLKESKPDGVNPKPNDRLLRLKERRKN